jgi:hypothetical protein
MAMRRRLWTLAAGLAWLCCCLAVASAAEVEPLSSPEKDVSDDLLRQALASEVKGDANEWRQRLEEAVSILPDEKLTNSLLGQVLVDGKWQSVQDLQFAAHARQRSAAGRLSSPARTPRRQIPARA